MAGFQLIKLRLKSFESSVLDRSVKDIVNTLNRTNSTFYGPIPMPRKIKKFTLNKGTNIDKKSRQQLEIRSHSRILLISSAPETVDALMKLDIAAGVEIQIKMVKDKNE